MVAIMYPHGAAICDHMEVAILCLGVMVNLHITLLLDRIRNITDDYLYSKKIQMGADYLEMEIMTDEAFCLSWENDNNLNYLRDICVTLLLFLEV